MSKASTLPERKKAAMYAKVDIWQNRVAGLLVMLVLCLQPLFLSGNRYLILTRDKFMLFVVYMLPILAAVAIIWIVRVARKPRLGPRERPYLADWAVLGFALVTLLSALFSPFKSDTNVWVGIYERYDGVVTQLLYIAVFLIVAKWYRPRLRHFILFGISATLVALIGILQFFGIDIFDLWGNAQDIMPVQNFYNISFRTTLGNVNIVSTYVCAAIMLSSLLYVKMRTKWKYLWLAAGALNFWLMELAGADSGRVGTVVAMILAVPFFVENLKVLGRTLIMGSTWIAAYALHKLFYEVMVLHSRTFYSLLPYIAAAAALLAAGLVLAIRGKETAGRDSPVRWKLGLLLVAACIAAGLAGAEILGKRDAEAGRASTIYEMREIVHGNISDEFGSRRIYIWRNALEVYPQHPLIGTGPDTFGRIFPEEAQMKYGERYTKAHNEYIQILICQGILGFLCYMLFIGATLAKSVPKAFRNPLVAAAMAAFIAYCAQSFFNIGVPIVSQFLWLFAGILANKNVREKGLEQ